MKAIILNEPGGVEQLITTDLPVPGINETEVLVQVKAISLNPVDVKTRAGKGIYGRLKEIRPLIIGWDISGIVVEIGKDVQGFKKGDEVFGMINFPGHGKAYAEYVAAPAYHLALKPSGVSHDSAAAATLAALTARKALTGFAKINPGDKVVIHGASGGVGHYAVQIANHLGSEVTGTSSAANKEFLKNLGVNEHVDYNARPFEQVIREADFVLDNVGGDTVDRSVAITKNGGSIVSILSGTSERAKEKGIHISSFLVHSSGEEMREIASWLEKGIIKSHIDHSFAFDELPQAHRQVETGKTKGKVIVRL